MKPKIYYSGDINIEHGGVLYTLENMKYGYAEAVRVTPCSDAGMSDNVYWVEQLTINIQTDPAKLESILEPGGYGTETINDHHLVDAHLTWGSYDKDGAKTVQLGKRQSGFGEVVRNVDVILRANASLRTYAENALRLGF